MYECDNIITRKVVIIMYCKKCGYKLNESDSRCPFCNHPVNEEIETVVFSIKKANKVEAQKEVIKEEPVVEDVRKQEYVNVSAPKILCG